MGCTQSKIDNEEAVSRCKDRRNFMREAVVARNAFASGHSGYAVALKNTGAALSEYAQGEVPPPPDLTAEPGPVGVNEPPPPPPPSISEANLPPPPPPLPNFSPLPPPMPSFSPSPATPLQRAVTMPAQQVRKMKGIDGVDEEEEDEEEGESNIGGLRQRDRRRKVVEDTASESETPIKTPMPPPPPDTKGMAWDYFYDNTLDSSLPEMEEEEEEEEDEDYMEEKNENQNVNFNKMGLNNDDINNFRTPEKLVRGIQIDEITPEIVKEKPLMHSNTAPPGYRFPGNTSSNVNSVDLLKVLSDIDDHFLKASESAQEVSKMLEATRLHYHSNFADNRGHIDHAARVMRVITWNRSFRGVPNGDNGKEEYDTEEYETHATVLDKLLAWEKKLYEEVKAGELMKLEYQRKVSVLNKLKKREASTEALERAKAAVSHLHTRYIVDMQSLDSTVSEVNDIRDKQLYPKLVALVNGMGRMWESMCIHHDDQLKIVNDLRSLDVSGSPKYTTEYHHNRTLQLLRVVDEWNLQFEKLTKNQKQYINALNSWLKLNLIPIESNLKEKISSPPRVENPPIQALLRSWNESLEKLPDELAKSATASFAAVIKAIIDHQLEEMKLKEKCDETRKEYLRKSQGFDDWYHKYMQKRGPEETDDTTSVGLNPIGEKKLVVDLLKKKLDEEEEDYYKHCVQVREKSIGSLKIRLPELFRAMSDYSHACFDAYQRLRAYTQVQMPNGGS